MSELRLNPFTGTWVIIAPDRAQRPNAERQWPPFDSQADNPFLEGREHDTPGELLAVRAAGTHPDTPGWQVRVFPNKYPAVNAPSSIPAGSPALHAPFAEVPFAAMTAAGPLAESALGIGTHEVIVECPHFATCLSELPVAHVAMVLETYRQRLSALRAQADCAHAMIFKNRGIAGGATLAHSHSQLIATNWVPPTIQQEWQFSRQYFEQHGCSYFQKLLDEESRLGLRIVVETSQFLVFCPFASRVPFEVWIVPKSGGDDFADASAEQIQQFADCLHQTLCRLQNRFPDLPYNFVLHSAPIPSPPQLSTTPGTAGGAPFYRWHLEILPRIGSIAGFEWGGGAYINSVPPETAAAQLRSIPRTSPVP